MPTVLERTLCGVDGCRNVRELSAQGRERATCYRHRASNVNVGVAERTRRREYAVKDRGDCLRPGCSRARKITNKGGRWYVKPFCQPCSKSLSVEEKRSFAPSYGEPGKPRPGRPYVDRAGYVHVWVAPVAGVSSIGPSWRRAWAVP